jgi:predicted Zn-dependent protease
MDKYTLIGAETVRTLGRVALLAACEGYIPCAERILSALELARPNEPTIQICRAIVLARQDRFAECVDLLQAVARQWPENQTVKSILGLMLFTSDAPGWKPLLQSVVADGSDRASVELAQAVLAEADKTGSSAPMAAKPTARRQFILYG